MYGELDIEIGKLNSSMRNNQYGDVLCEVERLRETYPDSDNLWNYYEGSALLFDGIATDFEHSTSRTKTKQIDKVIEILKKSIEQDSNFAKSYFILGMALSTKSSLASRELGAYTSGELRGYMSDGINSFLEACQIDNDLCDKSEKWIFGLEKKCEEYAVSNPT